MAGKPAYGTDYRRDFRELRRRGKTLDQCAEVLRISRRTLARWSVEESRRG